MTAEPPAPAGAHCVTEVATANASRYLQQLCKHFAHKCPATFDPNHGEVTFTFGECRLDAQGPALGIALAAPDSAQLAQLQDVIVRHLLRFAFRETLDIAWRQGPAS